MSPAVWATWSAWRWGGRDQVAAAQRLVDGLEAGPDQRQLAQVLASVVPGRERSALPEDLGRWWAERLQVDVPPGLVRCIDCGSQRSNLVTLCGCFFGGEL